MGTVLEAQDERLGRKVAIKVLSNRVADPLALEGFQREARLAAKLKHPNIAALYELGEDADQPYLVMEWVEGESLEERLRRGPLSLELALALLDGFVSALDYAHAKGVVHRDIKPANLMLTGERQLTLIDFGLATMLAEPQSSVTGPIFGTPLYMPPEIAAGEPVDGRADLYSAALVLFEMLVGKPPFGGGTVMQIISQQLNAPRPVLSEHAPQLPTALDDVLTKAMSRQPEQRYPTGKAFYQAVLSASGLTPERAPNSTRGLVPFLVIALMLTLGLLAAMAPGSPPPSTAPSAAGAATSTPSPSQPAALEWSVGDADAAGTMALYAVPTTAPTPVWRHRGAAPDYLVEAQGQLLGSGAGGTEVWQAETGKTLWRSSEGGQPFLSPRFEPERVLLCQDKGWVALDASDGKLLWRHNAKDEVLAGVLSDADTLYSVGGSTLTALEASDGQVLWTAQCSQPLLEVSPVIGSSGVFVATEGQQVEAYDESSHKRIWNVNTGASPSSLCFSPQGLLLVGCDDGTLLSYSMVTREDQWQRDESDLSSVLGLAAVPDLVVATAEEAAMAAFDKDGNLEWQVPLADEPMAAAQTDGDLILVAGSRQVQCLDATSSRVVWTVTAPSDLQGAPLCVDGWLFLPLVDGIQALREP